MQNKVNWKGKLGCDLRIPVVSENLELSSREAYKYMWGDIVEIVEIYEDSIHGSQYRIKGGENYFCENCFYWIKDEDGEIIVENE